jgi:formate hydrogenlyase transcriptional activator
LFSVLPTERALIEVAASLHAETELPLTCECVLAAFERMFEAEASWLLLHDESRGELVTVAAHGAGHAAYGGVSVPATQHVVGKAFSARALVFVPDVASETGWHDAGRVRDSGLQSIVTVPLVFDETAVGVVGLSSPRFTTAAPPSADDRERLLGVAAQATVAIRNAKALDALERERRRLRRLLDQRRQLRQEVGHLRNAVRDAQVFDAIVGSSAGLLEVMEQVELVAPADSTVLIIGETGTGKELVARAIHDASRRRAQAFVAVNCAALPESLLESELFGHERGAFTGALARKPGKFELADRGTLFLDEVGDLPALAQAKLLRALQEQEVHRVGGTRPVPINVRLIAATNCDLQEGMRSGTFRQDLYFRLSVFPIVLPPLRERRDDIAPLAREFVRRAAARQGKTPPVLDARTLDRLTAYDWPGNIRELQNVMERAVILARDGGIGADLVPDRSIAAAPIARSRPQSPAPAALSHHSPTVVAFTEAERRAIVTALEGTGWRISGRSGAAELLGLKPTTLHAKMKRLGISRPSPAAIGGEGDAADAAAAPR